MQTKDKEKDTLEAQVNKLKSSMESKEKDLAHYQRIEFEMQNLESQLKASNSQYKEEVIECDKLKGQNKLANEEISTLRNQIQEMKAEFEKVCQTNKGVWEKENEAINDKYQSLKKRVNKGEKRRETILSLAKKQKSQYQKEIDALKDSVICCQAREKQYELEKESLRKNHELEVNKLRRHIEQFKVRATEFESLLYNPIAGNSGNVSMPIPDSFSTILATTKEQQHELAEISKNLNDFQEKQADLEKVV
jgi:chromosome segregation ATPase